MLVAQWWTILPWQFISQLKAALCTKLEQYTTAEYLNFASESSSFPPYSNTKTRKEAFPTSTWSLRGLLTVSPRCFYRLHLANICATFSLPLPFTQDVESHHEQEWRKSRCSLMATFLVQASLTFHALFHRSSKK